MRLPLSRIAALTLVLLPAGAARPAGDEPLSVSVMPRRTGAPATVRVSVTVAAAAGAHSLLIEADSPDFYRSSLSELEGDRSAGRYEVRWKDLPPGEYVVSATLLGDGGASHHAECDLSVIR